MKRIWLAVTLVMISADGYGSNYGTTGLFDIPTARMAADGTFTTTAAISSRTNSYAITYQATPWLEATFRYTGFDNDLRWDRNYEAKVRLWEERGYLPQVAVGIRDIVGTGVAGTEYLVASKSFDNFDLTLGVGWGRLAGKGVISNPLKVISSDFASRKFDHGKGGEVSYQQFFSGEEIGFFGGLSYQFESLPVKAMVEYNPDQYAFEVSRGGKGRASPWTVGAAWQASPGVTLALSRQHNDEWAIEVSAALNSKILPPKRKPEYFKSSLEMRQDEMPTGMYLDRWYDRLLFDMEQAGLLLIEAKIDAETETANLVIGNQSFSVWADAIARATALAELHLPVNVRSINLVIDDQGHRVHTIHIARVVRPGIAVVRSAQDRRSLARQLDVLPGRHLAPPKYETEFVTGKVSFDISVANRLQLFDPDDPARYQVYLKLGAAFRLPAAWVLYGTYAVDVVNNFDEINRGSNSVLPHVRTDVAEYLKQGATGLDALYLENRGTWRRGVHYRVFGGVLEEMYSGVGGEVLVQPHGSRLALGVSANWAKKRDFDRSFSHLDYQTTTAFVSAYWATPFYNYDVAVHMGRYLAKDVGATLEVRRTFDNGWMIGLWATLTDVPFDDFGEGSFDKGMFFTIPLDGMLGRNTRSAYSTRIRPIQRDGGQRLENFGANLWFDLRGSRYDALNER